MTETPDFDSLGKDVVVTDGCNQITGRGPGSWPLSSGSGAGSTIRNLSPPALLSSWLPPQARPLAHQPFGLLGDLETGLSRAPSL